MGTVDEQNNVGHVDQTGCVTMAERSKTLNGVDEGSGSYRQGYHKTNLGRWLTLFRVQSFPISAVIVSMGYLITAETVIIGDILGLVAVAVVAHAGVNTQNDLIDYHVDMRNKEDDKPLVSGDIGFKQATFVCSVLIASSLIMSMMLFPMATPVFGGALASAIIYNLASSTKWWSPVAFGVWGMVFSLYGIMAGSPYFDRVGLMYSLSIGMMMSSFIFYGNVIDSDTEEVSIHRILGGEVVDIEESLYFIPGEDVNEEYIIIFFALWTGILMTASVTLLGVGYAPVIIAPLMSFAAYKIIKDTCHPVELGEQLKKDFLIYVITTCTVTLGVFSAAVGVVNTAFIILTSIIWAVVVMRSMYGRWLYFP